MRHSFKSAGSSFLSGSDYFFSSSSLRNNQKDRKKNLRSEPKVNGLYSGPRRVLHPSFMEIRRVVFCVILLTNQQKKPDLHSVIKM